MVDSFDTKLLKLSKIFSDEQASFSYLLRSLRKRQYLLCPNCEHDDFYLLSRYRLKCKKCRREFRPLANTKFSLLNIKFSNWLMLIKLFELGFVARQACQEVAISYKTTLKAYRILRGVIIDVLSCHDPLLKSAIKMIEEDSNGVDGKKHTRNNGDSTVIYGLIEMNKNVKVDVITDIDIDMLMNDELKKVKKGSIIYTDKCKGYDCLICCGVPCEFDSHFQGFVDQKVYVDTVDGFWQYAKDRLNRHKGVTQKKFIYYLKEMEWRYNHKNQNLFDLIINYLLVPISN